MHEFTKKKCNLHVFETLFFLRNLFNNKMVGFLKMISISKNFDECSMEKLNVKFLVYKKMALVCSQWQEMKESRVRPRPQNADHKVPHRTLMGNGCHERFFLLPSGWRFFGSKRVLSCIVRAICRW